MKICFDLDDVICNTYVELMEKSMHYHMDILKRDYIYRKIEASKGDYSYFYKTLGWEIEDLTGFFYTEYPNFLLECTPNKHIVDLIRKLRSLGNEIHIVSAREERRGNIVYKITEQWLGLWKVEYDKLLIGVTHKSKYLCDNHIDYFFDDLWENCVEAKKYSSSVVCHIRCSYNQEMNCDYTDGIIEIKKENQLYDLFDLNTYKVDNPK